MPVKQRLAFIAKSIGAGRRQPLEFIQLVLVELDTVGNQLLAVRIVGAGAVSPVEELASNVGRKELAGILILKLVKAATAAPVTQGFPFAAVERRQRLFPEGNSAIHAALSNGA